MQTTSTPTPSETTEPQSASPPDRESGVSTASTTSDPLDTRSSGGSSETKTDNDDSSRAEGEDHRTDNDVDEGVDLQGKSCIPGVMISLEKQITIIIILVFYKFHTKVSIPWVSAFHRAIVTLIFN